jgi:intracellular sulfur oxidation DsrE/DsrF family protein
MKLRLLLVCLLLVSAPLQAGDAVNPRLSRLLAAAQPPEGVVFEIIAWEDNTWDWAAPMLREQVDRLRARYPRLAVALVSHGAELFDLVVSSALRDGPAIRELEHLSTEGVDIHVCGQYASWKRLGPRDFPEFVDLAASGSAQLADYIDLGFEHIRLERPHATD